MKSHRVFTWIFLTSVFSFLMSCENDLVIKQPGHVQFTWAQEEGSGGKSTEEVIPKSVLVTILDSQGNTLVLKEKLSLYIFGAGYLSESLQLLPGTYQLAEFVVLDEMDKIMYASPLEGSEQAQYVNDPLPIEFEVTESGNTQLVPQVLAVTDESTPESFGYVSFGFEVVDGPAKLMELWIDDGPHEHYKVLFSYNGDQLHKTNLYYSYDLDDNGWIWYDSTTFQYDGFGRLIQRENSASWRMSFQYDSGKLKSMTRSEAGSEIPAGEFEYFYDQNGALTHATQNSPLQHFDYEFVVNGDGNILNVKRFAVTVLARTLQYEVNYTYHPSLINNALKLTGLLDFDPFFHGAPNGNHNIASFELKRFHLINGISTEEYSCTTSMSYITNTVVTEAVSINPNGCSLGYNNGMKFTYIYQ